MSDIFTLIKGTTPLMISMPHNGQKIAPEILGEMNPKGAEISDTDWYMDKLYDFAIALGATILMPKYNRYVIDLNRDTKGVNLYPGANSTELCPTTAFDLTPLYREGCEPSTQEIQRRIEKYWQPYHDALQTELNALKAEFGQVVLLDAHSILSHVPRFFSGKLPDFNFGTVDGASCDAALLAQVEASDFSPYTTIANGRFKGGFITRAYGKPDDGIHAIQLELSQSTYMDENTLEYNHSLAEAVKPKLKAMVQSLIDFSLNKRA